MHLPSWGVLSLLTGTLAHRHGGPGFQPQKQTRLERPATSAHSSVGDVKAFQTQIKKAAREAMLRRRDLKAVEKERAERCHNVAVSSAVEILQPRRMLAGVGCKWYGQPHTCPSLVVTCRATEAQASHETGVTELAHDWCSRHDGVVAGQKQKVKGDTNACFQEGFCHCTNEHSSLRKFVGSLKSILKDLCRNKEEQQLISDGYMVIALFTDVPATGMARIVFGHIALHYFSPFRPTLVGLRHLPSDEVENEDQLLEVLLSQDPRVDSISLTICLEDRDEDTDLVQVRSLLEWASVLDLALCWQCRVLYLSDRCQPAILPPGSVRALFKGGPQTLWQPGEERARDALLHLLLHDGQRLAHNNAEPENDEEGAGIAEDLAGDASIEVLEDREAADVVEWDPRIAEDPEAVTELFRLWEEAHDGDDDADSNSSSSSSSSSEDSVSKLPSLGSASHEGGQVPAEPEDSVVPAEPGPAPEQPAGRARHEALQVYDQGLPVEMYVRYKPSSADYYLNCPAHAGCSRTRTLLPGHKRRQGRPLGELAAWGLSGREIGSKAEHMRFNPTLATRQIARAQLKNNRTCDVWTARERACGADEGSEPE